MWLQISLSIPSLIPQGIFEWKLPRRVCPAQRQGGCAVIIHTSVNHWPRPVPRRMSSFRDICGQDRDCQSVAVPQKRKQVWAFSSQHLQQQGNRYGKPRREIWANRQLHLLSVDPAIPNLVTYPQIHLQTCKAMPVQVYSLHLCK